MNKKIKKHNIEEKLDLGGVYFCEKCIDEGAKRINKKMKGGNENE